MDFITPLVSIVDRLYDSIARRIGHITHFRDRVRKLERELEELKNIRDDLKREIDRAELGGSASCTNQVKGWLDRVGKIEAAVSSILMQPMQNQGRCFSKPSCSSRYRLSKKALKMEREISHLISRKENLVSVKSGVSRGDLRPNRPTVGLTGAFDTALQFIADDEVGTFGIYGMGGVGKTTLLKQINNEFLESSDFEAVIWVTVSKDLGPDRIQHAVLSRLGLPWEESESQEQQASRIYNFMGRIKFLLLLDDVWKGLDLEKIGIPLPDKTNKCKVVFTTRSMDVCSQMDANEKLKVDFLDEQDSWRLFCEKAGEATVMQPHIKLYAQEIVKKCGGLPLALITVGRAMANRKTEEEWKYALEVLNNAPSELQGMEDVFTLLKFSYENLHDHTLKMCFLYCALFPEGYPLEKEQLIDYWIREGFLDDPNGGSIHNKGHAIIGSLKVACLLETSEDETQVKMHDVVRNFALWIASSCGKNKETILVQGCNGLTGSPGVKRWKEAEWISLLDNEIPMMIEMPFCPKLSTLLLNWNCSLSKISNDFFRFMPSLKVLDLSATSIREIPESIGQLVELRYLDLSRTKITTLPRQLGNLSKLRHLDLQRTHLLKTIPRETISGLPNLRVLNLYYSYGEWEMLPAEAERELRFQDLTNLKHLSSLGITVTEFSALKKLSEFYSVIQYIFIKGCEGLVHLTAATVYGAGEKLRRLSIYNCNTLKEIDIGSEVGKDWMPSLEVLALHTLPNLNTIHRNSLSTACHRNLRYIHIWYCPKLRNLSWILQLPRLETIYVFYCEAMEEIIGETEAHRESSELHFPELKTISFRGLPKLRTISEVTVSFPMLQTIALIDCPELRKLPSKGYNSSNVPIVYCTKEWWDNLDWDDATSSSTLHPQFIAI